MFTFRAESHCDAPQPSSYASTYVVHEADTYEVQPIKPAMPVTGPLVGGISNGNEPHPESGTAVILRRGSFPIFEDNTLTIYVGSKCNFAVVFVMNEKGKTVDTIR